MPYTKFNFSLTFFASLYSISVQLPQLQSYTDVEILHELEFQYQFAECCHQTCQVQDNISLKFRLASGVNLSREHKYSTIPLLIHSWSSWHTDPYRPISEMCNSVCLNGGPALSIERCSRTKDTSAWSECHKCSKWWYRMRNTSHVCTGILLQHSGVLDSAFIWSYKFPSCSLGQMIK